LSSLRAQRSSTDSSADARDHAHLLPSPGGQGDRLGWMLKLDLDELNAG
jgi:hypothetical protein